MRLYRPVPVLALDLDGTVREGPDDPIARFVNGPEDVRVFPQAITLMRAWKKAKAGRIIAISNAGGIAMGYTTDQRISAALEETDRQCHQLFDVMLYCPHHPDAPNPEQARCWCRKPSPGLLVAGLLMMGQRFHEAYPSNLGVMVGDRPEDQECARLAGFAFQSASEWRASSVELVKEEEKRNG